MLKPPKRREDESALEYVERLDWHRKQLPREALQKPFRGAVATGEGFKPWTDSWRIGETSGGVLNPKHIQNHVFDVPEVKKTSPTEKMERLTSMLIEDARQKYQKTGRVEFSRSILRRLSELTGLTAEQLEAQTLDSLTSIYATYAARLLVEAENKQT